MAVPPAFVGKKQTPDKHSYLYRNLVWFLLVGPSFALTGTLGLLEHNKCDN